MYFESRANRILWWMNIEWERKKTDNDDSEVSTLSNLKNKLPITWNQVAVDVVFGEKIRRSTAEREVSSGHLSRMLNLNFGRNTWAKGINLGVVDLNLEEITEGVCVNGENKRIKDLSLVYSNMKRSRVRQSLFLSFSKRNWEGPLRKECSGENVVSHKSREDSISRRSEWQPCHTLLTG